MFAFDPKRILKFDFENKKWPSPEAAPSSDAKTRRPYRTKPVGWSTADDENGIASCWYLTAFK